MSNQETGGAENPHRPRCRPRVRQMRKCGKAAGDVSLYRCGPLNPSAALEGGGIWADRRQAILPVQLWDVPRMSCLSLHGTINLQGEYVDLLTAVRTLSLLYPVKINKVAR